MTLCVYVYYKSSPAVRTHNQDRARSQWGLPVHAEALSPHCAPQTLKKLLPSDVLSQAESAPKPISVYDAPQAAWSAGEGDILYLGVSLLGPIQIPGSATTAWGRAPNDSFLALDLAEGFLCCSGA